MRYLRNGARNVAAAWVCLGEMPGYGWRGAVVAIAMFPLVLFGTPVAFLVGMYRGGDE